MDLERLLESKNRELSSDLEKIKDYCIKYWKVPLLHWYTNHGFGHSKEIIFLIGQILNRLGDNFLAEEELFILLASAYLHDIGMQDLKEIGITREQISTDSYAEIREKHAEYSYNLIIKEMSKYNLLRVDYIDLVAYICKGHSTNYFDHVLEILKDNKYKPNDRKIRSRLITALLLIGDELDLHCKRVADIFNAENFEPSKESKVHWYKHYYITSVEINDEGSVKIIMVFPEGAENYGKLFKLLVKEKLDKQIKKVIPIFQEEKVVLLNANVSIDDKYEKCSKKDFQEEKDLLPELKKMLSKNVIDIQAENSKNSNEYKCLFLKGKFYNNYIIFGNDEFLKIKKQITISLRILFYDIKSNITGYDWQSIVQKSHYSHSFGLMLHTGRSDLLQNEKRIAFYLNGCDIKKSNATEDKYKDEPDGRVSYIWENVQENRWYNIICTYDGNKALIYIDGHECQNVDVTGEMQINSENIYIGMDSEGYYPLKGEIEDLIVMDRAVALEEIEKLSGKSFKETKGVEH